MVSVGRLLRSKAWAVAIGFAVVAYVFHSVGNTQGYYTRYWWFQIAAHYVSATALALLLARTALDAGLRGWHRYAFVVGGAGVGAVGWEVVEYLAIFPNLHFWGIGDSLLDLTVDALGVATVLVLLRTRFRPVVDPRVQTPTLAELVTPRK